MGLVRTPLYSGVQQDMGAGHHRFSPWGCEQATGVGQAGKGSCQICLWKGKEMNTDELWKGKEMNTKHLFEEAENIRGDQN